MPSKKNKPPMRLIQVTIKESEWTKLCKKYNKETGSVNITPSQILRIAIKVYLANNKGATCTIKKNPQKKSN